MALLRYIRSKEGFPEPRGPPSLSIPLRGTSRVNQEVHAIHKHSREDLTRNMTQNFTYKLESIQLFIE